MSLLTSGAVKARALELGFDLCGIAPVGAFPELTFLDEWLARGYAGEMHYLARSAERRADVRAVLPSARSVIVTATNYNTARPYSVDDDDPARAQISRYAWGDDYHDVIKQRLDALVEWMRVEHAAQHARAGQAPDDVPFEARAYVDTGPVQERVYAQYAGIGWIGKNTCVISGKRGSWLFLSEIICSLPLDADAPATDRCGTCTRCLDACPTDALVEPWVLDSRRCLSYLTIEVKGALAEADRERIGTHVYGCDICQDVCPWNRAPLLSEDLAWQPRPGLDRTTLATLWQMPDEALRALLKGSPMKRAGLKRLRRNLAIAIAHSGDPAAVAALGTACAGAGWESLDDPLVREQIAWARARCTPVHAAAHATAAPPSTPPPESQPAPPLEPPREPPSASLPDAPADRVNSPVVPAAAAAPRDRTRS
jgi:epoxyqueuosine reductase